jgi:hypothetical protein|tara:strand:- start:7854 stop:8036 length:183 start_codon:yes stop_codon:yes gene_type:complete
MKFEIGDLIQWREGDYSFVVGFNHNIGPQYRLFCCSFEYSKERFAEYQQSFVERDCKKVD